jgi:hypothetical protein
MLKYRPGRRMVAGIATAMALVPTAATAADATWEAWLPIPGVLDLDGPRSDGTFVVAGSAALYTLDAAGNVQPFARGPGGYREDAGKHAYLAVSTGGHVVASACDFARDETYVLRLHTPIGLNRVSADGTESGPFVNVDNVTTLTGIAFDSTGSFDHRLLVMGRSGNKTDVFAIDCNGVGQFIARGLPALEGQMAVAPTGFGAFGGDLIIPDEAGRILALTPGGALRVVVARPLPAGVNVTLGGVGFVPEGFTDRGGFAYHADRRTPGSTFPGSDTLFRLSSDVLAAAGIQDGDLLAAAEDGGALIAVSCETACRTVRVLAGDNKAHVEGHIAFTVNAPAPTPAATPAAAVRRSLVPPAVADFVGLWGIPTVVLILLLGVVAALAVQAFRHRAR